MGPPCTALADQHDRFFALDIAAFRKISYTSRRDLLHLREVELIDRLQAWQLGIAEAAGDGAPVALFALDGQQSFEVANIVNAFIEAGSQTVAKKMNFLTSDPAEDVNMSQTKPQMTQKQILALISGIQDPHDPCLMYVGIFCGPRASEVMGLQWKSWTGTTLVPHGTAFEGAALSRSLQNAFEPGAHRSS